MAGQMRRLILTAVALVVAVVAAGLLLRAPETPTVSEPEPPQEISYGSGAVTAISVENGAGEYVVSSDGVTGLSDALTDAGRVAELIKAFSVVSPDALVDEAPPDPSLYGLSEPSAVAEITYAAGADLQIKLGNQEPVSGSYYCEIGDAGAVYLLGAETAVRLLDAREDYISRQITPECLTASPLSAVTNITFSDGEGKIEIESCANPSEEMRREMRSFGAVTHVIHGPGILHEVDRTYAQEIFGSLFGLRAMEIVRYGLTEAEMDEFGFDEADMTVVFGIENGDAPDTPEQIWTLRVLFQMDETVLMAVNDVGVVYRVARPAFLDAEYSGFVTRWFVSPLLTDLRALRIEAGGCERIYEIGGTAAEPIVRLNGETLDMTGFRTFYTLVVSAAGDGNYLGEVTPEDAPILTITYDYADGQKPSDVLAFYPKNARTLYVSVNGVTEFSMRAKFADMLLDAIAALEAGEDIVTSW